MSPRSIPGQPVEAPPLGRAAVTGTLSAWPSGSGAELPKQFAQKYPTSAQPSGTLRAALEGESWTRFANPHDYFKSKNMGDVRLRLGGLADDVPVTLGPGVLLPDVRTVGDLRALRAWSKSYRLVGQACFY